MFAMLLSFASGFLSLSIEILWIRLFSYANHSLPQAFTFVLTFYLIGIALGAFLGKRFCNGKYDLWFISGITLYLASIFDIISPWIYVNYVDAKHTLILAGTLMLLSSLFKAILFPITHHLGTLQINANLGRNISKVYVSNIFGATLGPLITGFILLSIFTTQQTFIICAGLSFVVGSCCLYGRIKLFNLGLNYIGAAFVIYLLALINPNSMISKLNIQDLNTRRIVENQYGIITTYYGGAFGDYIYGANVYDGRTNLSPIYNSNNINRILVLAALTEKKPAQVLMIGLSIGTWLKLVTGFPDIGDIDVVEINPGYLVAMADYPEQQSALADPRVHVYIDDGRRWLKTHPDKKYDLVVMNTTYYWRAYSGNLLSREFISLLKSHMNEHAVVSYNTTDSPDALKTATEVFKHAYLYQNFVVASDDDWRLKLHNPTANKRLAAIMLDGQPLFRKNDQTIINNFLNMRIKTLADIEPFYQGLRELEVITDNNLICEYKYGRTLS